MTWRDQLRPASFRGVEFHVTAAPRKGGRRLAPHEYAGRDDVFAEDLGRRGRAFPVTAFVVGDEFLSLAQRLVDALENAGPGTLVHPWLGEKTVAVDEFTESYSSQLGGYVEISITFIETVSPTYPAATADLAGKVDEAALSADEVALRQLAADFEAEGLVDFVTEDVGGAVSDLVSDIKETIGPIVERGMTYARWAQGVVATARDALSLVQSPQLLGARLLGLLDLGAVTGNASLLQTALDLPGQISSLLGSAGSAVIPSWRTWLGLADWTVSRPSVPQTTPTRRQQAQNREALASFVRVAAVAQAARVAARTEFPSYDEAAAARTELSDRIDALQENAAPETYRALSSLRAAVVQSVSAAAPELPRLIAVTPPLTVPAAVIAHQTFGDDPVDSLARADELLARNGVRHPMFVPGGTTVQLLSRTPATAGTGAR